MNILTPKIVNQPRIVTLAELESKLLPLCYGNKWALSTIKDLWTKGAPIPQPEGEPERRILIPEQFKLWWDDLNTGLGFAVDGHGIYSVLQRRMRASAGQRILRK